MKKGNNQTHWPSKTAACEGLNLSRRQFDRILALPGNPGKDSKGYPIEVWKAFASAVADPANELKRLRAELLRVQIERLRGNLIDRKLYIDQTDAREIALVSLVENWRSSKLGKMRDPSEAKMVDDLADSFRQTMRDALEQDRVDYDKRISESVGGDMVIAAEDADLEVGD
jgi:hypothetical protein